MHSYALRGTSMVDDRRTQDPADLARQLAAFIESQQPSVYCCGCLAKHLEADEGRVRDTVQTLVIGPRRRFVLSSRQCVSCQEPDPVIVFLRGE
jgi:hypothetical protein